MLPFQAVGDDGDFDRELAREGNFAVAADMCKSRVAQYGGVAESQGVDGARETTRGGDGVEAVVVDAVGGEDDGSEVGAFVEFGDVGKNGGDVGLRFGEREIERSGRRVGNGVAEGAGEHLVVAGEA